MKDQCGRPQYITERIQLWGIVQGVGFRPFVAKLAKRFAMRGTVANTGGLVELTLTDTPARIEAFLAALQQEKPAPAEIVHMKRTVTTYTAFDGFRILASASEADASEAVMIPPDMALCPDCLQELYTEGNPRHLHPFISCMICGPRYTIIDRVPYDRDNTAMTDFPMCGFCNGEYTDLSNRRHHAQTISCHHCGPYLQWITADSIDGDTGAGMDRQAMRPRPAEKHPEDPRSRADILSGVLRTQDARRWDATCLDRAAEALRAGGVIACKSLGGYNLVCDPFSEAGVETLRALKGRENKPFALLFRDMEQIRRFCYVNDIERRLLQSSARPILLLEHRLKDMDARQLQTLRGDVHALPWTEDLLRSRFIGSFLPSLGAQYLLLDRISPLIFTSANVSGQPMLYRDEDMLDWLQRETRIRGVLIHDRQIRIPVDDSVVRVIDAQPQMIRRSKGYAPLPLHVMVPETKAPVPAVLAMGSQLKNSFALTKGSFVYMSQYFGDLDTAENQQLYLKNVYRMSRLFRIQPQQLVCDLHPLYESTHLAEDLARKHGLPLMRVQHHHAHVASVMAENQLTGKVIGISFDGTGYGTDGCIWGGEVLICEQATFQRFSHLRYVRMIGGDASMKDARRSAFSYLAAEAAASTASSSAEEDPGDPAVRTFHIDLSDIIAFGSERLLACPDSHLILRALELGINTIHSSSMGRLFDAVAALLGIRDYNHYEGQCAIELEDAAAFAQAHPGEDPASDLALLFHRRIIDAIAAEAELARQKTGADQVALTGGTFQNKILMEGTLEKLRERGFHPYYNISVSPNDGGIALGQAFIALQQAAEA